MFPFFSSLSGTMSPTSSPNYVMLTDAGGCPPEYTSGYEYSEYVGYEGGDLVTWNKIVFKCRPFPYSMWCNMAGFEPGSDESEKAWIIVGYCEGTSPRLRRQLTYCRHTDAET